MATVRIIFFALLIVYLLMAFAFLHITITYQANLKKSKNTLHNLFAGQSALFTLIEEEIKAGIFDENIIKKALINNELSFVNKTLLESEKEYRSYFGKKDLNSNLTQIMQAVHDNVTLIRNEVYRYNKFVDNLNVNRQSIIFSLFVVMLRLKEYEKI